MLDDIEQTADCGDSQFQACMTSCENDYFGQPQSFQRLQSISAGMRWMGTWSA